MSEPLHNIDKLFKQAIDQHEDNPSPAVWNAIDKNLDKEKVVSISRKYNKLKWVAAILLLFSAGMAMYTWFSKTKNDNVVKEKINQPINKPSTNKEKTNIPETASTKNNQPPTKNPQINSAQQSSDNNNLKNNNLNKNIPGQTAVNNSADLQKANNADKNEPENILNRDLSAIPIISQLYPASGNQNLQKSQLLAVPLTSIPSVISNQPVADNNTGNTSGKIKSIKTKNNRPSLFGATVFFSPEFISSNVKNDHPRYHEDDRNEIKNNEHTKSSNSFGVLLNYAFGNLKVESGVSVFTRKTEISSKTIYARPDNNGNVNFHLNCSAGAATVTLKSVTTPSAGDSAQAVSSGSTLRYVSIPVGVKYSLGKGKLTVSPGISFSANILSKGAVETTISKGGTTEGTTSNDIQGLKPNYFSGAVGLDAEYKIGKNISLSLIPSGKFALTSINKDGPVKTSLNGIAVAAGVTVHF